MTEALEAARRYAALGLSVFPLRPRSKAPLTPRGHLDATTDAAVLTRWWRRWLDAGVGIACQPSGLLVVDVDPRNGGDDSLADLERLHEPLPPTWRAITGGYGLHCMFRVPTGVGVRDGALVPGVDVKANGYIVTPPSLHPNGRQYAWEIGFAPETVPLAPLPQWLLSMLAARGRDGLRADGTALVIQAGARNATLYRLGCLLRRYGIAGPAIRECLSAINRAHAVPPLEADELVRIAASAARYTPASPRRVQTGDREDEVVARALGVV